MNLQFHLLTSTSRPPPPLVQPLWTSRLVSAGKATTQHWIDSFSSENSATTPSYLFQGKTQIPQQRPIFFKAFSACFISLLMVSRPSSMWSICSASKSPDCGTERFTTKMEQSRSLALFTASRHLHLMQKTKLLSSQPFSGEEQNMISHKNKFR